MTDIPDRLRAALAERYRIDQEVGQGGMATVYRAEDLKHARPVAIKVLRPELASLGYEPARFLREIRIAARLNHPQILPLHDSGQCDGILYYVMPYMTGETLRRRLDRDKQLPIDEALRIVRAVALALDYAHRQDVLHRDIKPENILLQEGEPVVADFGVARAISAAGADVVTERGLTVGTPTYMSPEQAGAERELDGRSDVYSLACVLYEMLAGQPPFSGSNAQATMFRQATETAPSIRAVRPNVPPAIEQALAKALAKDPAHRIPTAAAFAEALALPAVEISKPLAGVGVRGGDGRAIAVLPFVNTSPDPENEYFSDGMTDELINALTKVEGLHVASRTSVFALKGKPQDIRTIGALLNVSTVLEGTVRKVGPRLRITAQLTDAIDGRHLWSERFDRDVQDVFAIQDEIAHTIVNTLRAQFLGDLGDPTPKRYTDSVIAYNLYLKGRYHWNQRTQEGIAEGIKYFRQAIAEDPGYALAYTGLSDSFSLEGDYRGVPVGEFMQCAKENARRALALDETLAEAHTSLAWVTFLYDWDWATAERHFARAIELNPRYASAHQWYAWVLLVLRRFEEAIAAARRAVELDPVSVSARRSLGWLYVYARQPDEAIDQLRRAIGMNPTAEETHRILGLAYLQKGMLDEADRALREATAISSETSYSLAALGFVAALRGRRDEAERILHDLERQAVERYVSPVAFVIIHIALGDTARAFASLEQTYAERRGWLVYLKVDPLLDGLRQDPRFAQLVERVRLP